ncbi:MAG: hypothetical protein WDN45_03570 [Caulobacteraceae bacterium]
MNAIGSLGAQTGLQHIHHGHHARGAGAAAATDPTADPADADDADPSIAETQASASPSAGGASANPLSSSTLSSLLGLQMVDGQVQGGAGGVQLGLPQITEPSALDPNILLQDPNAKAAQTTA